ncbi:hypothetical protein Cni_G13178 [Canna indica]|uniref:Uncharacterized protein n=1 Tax=Canna indica TaxID=4628 RepID=A0AAQ3KDH5_9LILI|nr:hypothetical protein Cni_G13178 [Canna indica]
MASRLKNRLQAQKPASPFYRLQHGGSAAYPDSPYSPAASTSSLLRETSPPTACRLYPTLLSPSSWFHPPPDSRTARLRLRCEQSPLTACRLYPTSSPLFVFVVSPSPDSCELVRPYLWSAFNEGESKLSLSELGLSGKQEALFL